MTIMANKCSGNLQYQDYQKKEGWWFGDQRCKLFKGAVEQGTSFVFSLCSFI